MTKFSSSATVCKVDRKLGLVFGYAVVCKRNGEDYFDLQDENVPEDEMMEAATEFMRGARTAGDMHKSEDGTVVFAFPLTTEVASALEIKARDLGLLVAVKPDSEETLAKAERGEYTGFSIAGTADREDA